MGRTSDVEYKMRMTQELKDKIVESAKGHNRSMNADIVARLEKSFDNIHTIPSDVMTFEQYKNIMEESMEKYIKAVHDQSQKEVHQKLIKQNSQLLDEILSLKAQLAQNNHDK